MSPVTYIIIGIIIAVAVTWGITTDVRRFRREQAVLLALARTPIGELIDGAHVRIVGTAVSNNEYVRAPYSGRLCLAFRARTRSVDLSGLLQRYPQHVYSDPVQRVIAFRVKDDSGEIELDVEHVKFLLRDDEVDPQEAHGLFVTSLGGNIDYHEESLVENQRVSVIGVVRRGREGALKLVGTAEEPLVVSTRHGALDS